MPLEFPLSLPPRPKRRESETDGPEEVQQTIVAAIASFTASFSSGESRSPSTSSSSVSISRRSNFGVSVLRAGSANLSTVLPEPTAEHSSHWPPAQVCALTP